MSPVENENDTSAAPSTSSEPPELTGRVDPVPMDGNCLFTAALRELKRLVDLLVAGEDGRVSEQLLVRLLTDAAPPGGSPAITPQDKAMEKLVHDVRTKASSLKSAVALLKSAPPAKTRELLALMTKQAGALASTIAAFERTGAP